MSTLTCCKHGVQACALHRDGWVADPAVIAERIAGENSWGDQASLETQISDDAYACTICGGINTVDGDTLPSMVGYGDDGYDECSRCGTYQTFDPMFGSSKLHPRKAARS